MIFLLALWGLIELVKLFEGAEISKTDELLGSGSRNPKGPDPGEGS